MLRLRVPLAVLVLLILILGLVWLLQRRLIYFPDRAAPPVAAGAQEVVLATEDGLKLSAWLVRPGKTDLRTAVLVAPGNAGNRLGRMPLAAALAGRGLTVLLLDYRGYGGNPGNPGEEGLARDIRAARAYVVGQLKLPVIYYGESLGAAVATRLAVQHPPVGLVLRSPFTDLAAAGREHYPFLPVRLLLRDRFPVAEQIRQVTVPTLVVHGTADTVVPAEQSRAVAAHAGGAVRVVAVEGAGHNDRALLDGPQLVDAVVELARGRVS